MSNNWFGWSLRSENFGLRNEFLWKWRELRFLDEGRVLFRIRFKRSVTSWSSRSCSHFDFLKLCLMYDMLWSLRMRVQDVLNVLWFLMLVALGNLSLWSFIFAKKIDKYRILNFRRLRFLSWKLFLHFRLWLILYNFLRCRRICWCWWFYWLLIFNYFSFYLRILLFSLMISISQRFFTCKLYNSSYHRLLFLLLLRSKVEDRFWIIK